MEPGRYTHFKGGEYEVLSSAYHTDDLSELVVYQQLYNTPDFPKGTLWVRPRAEFESAVVVDGVETPRFARHD